MGADMQHCFIPDRLRWHLKIKQTGQQEDPCPAADLRAALRREVSQASPRRWLGALAGQDLPSLHRPGSTRQPSTACKLPVENFHGGRRLSDQAPGSTTSHLAWHNRKMEKWGGPPATFFILILMLNTSEIRIAQL